MARMHALFLLVALAPPAHPPPAIVPVPSPSLRCGYFFGWVRL
jgi:hypothetical protein